MIAVGFGAGIGFQNNPIQSPPLTLPQFRAPTLVSAPVVSGSGDVGRALSVTPAVWDAASGADNYRPVVAGRRGNSG